MAPVPENDEDKRRRAAVKSMRDARMDKRLPSEKFRLDLVEVIRADNKEAAGKNAGQVIEEYRTETLSGFWERLDLARRQLDYAGEKVTDEALKAKLSDPHRQLYDAVKRELRLGEGETVAGYIRELDGKLLAIDAKRMDMRREMVDAVNKQLENDPNRALILNELQAHYAKKGGDPVEAMVDKYLDSRFYKYRAASPSAFPYFGINLDLSHCFSMPPDYGRKLVPALESIASDLMPPDIDDVPAQPDQPGKRLPVGPELPGKPVAMGMLGELSPRVGAKVRSGFNGLNSHSLS